jgi:hypothetical protein
VSIEKTVENTSLECDNVTLCRSRKREDGERGVEKDEVERRGESVEEV